MEVKGQVFRSQFSHSKYEDLNAGCPGLEQAPLLLSHLLSYFYFFKKKKKIKSLPFGARELLRVLLDSEVWFPTLTSGSSQMPVTLAAIPSSGLLSTHRYTHTNISIHEGGSFTLVLTLQSETVLHQLSLARRGHCSKPVYFLGSFCSIYLAGLPLDGRKQKPNPSLHSRSKRIVVRGGKNLPLSFFQILYHQHCQRNWISSCFLLTSLWVCCFHPPSSSYTFS